MMCAFSAMNTHTHRSDGMTNNFDFHSLVLRRICFYNFFIRNLDCENYRNKYGVCNYTPTFCSHRFVPRRIQYSVRFSRSWMQFLFLSATHLKSQMATRSMTFSNGEKTTKFLWMRKFNSLCTAKMVPNNVLAQKTVGTAVLIKWKLCVYVCVF